MLFNVKTQFSNQLVRLDGGANEAVSWHRSFDHLTVNPWFVLILVFTKTFSLGENSFCVVDAHLSYCVFDRRFLPAMSGRTKYGKAVCGRS